MFVTMGKKLERIDLSGNRITFISPTTFSGHPNLAEINLQGNNLKCLSVANLASDCLSPEPHHRPRHRRWMAHFPTDLTSLAHVRLRSNPWKCECPLWTAAVHGSTMWRWLGAELCDGEEGGGGRGGGAVRVLDYLREHCATT